MKHASLGVDIGSVSTKAVVVDQDNRIVASDYIWTQGDPVGAVRRVLQSLRSRVPRDTAVGCVGTTGSARKLIGAMLEADAVKNEITAHALGTLSRFPGVRTIVEIGGQDSKLILLRDGVVVDYAMNSLCAAGTGAFLSAQAARLGLEVERLGEVALRAQNPAKIAARCTVFAESDLVHKAQAGYSKEDLVAGLCAAVVGNYMGNIGKGKRLEPPIVFQGGVSKNKGVVAAFEAELAEEIHVDPHSHLMGALGAAILAGKAARPHPFDFSVTEQDYQTRACQCGGCANACEIVGFYRNGTKIDAWGARCGNPKATD